MRCIQHTAFQFPSCILYSKAEMHYYRQVITAASVGGTPNCSEEMMRLGTAQQMLFNFNSRGYCNGNCLVLVW